MNTGKRDSIDLLSRGHFKGDFIPVIHEFELPNDLGVQGPVVCAL